MAANNFNHDEFVQPKWMDESFFTKALSGFEHDPNLKVRSLDFKPATQVGDHFASVMYRVTAEYDIPKYKKVNEKRVMIVKTVPFVEGIKAEILKDSSFFKTEIRMYCQILPEMERVLAAAGDHTRICPRLIYQSFDPAPVIVLEDISVTGFEMTQKPVDYKTTLKIASVLAKFHATSMYIQAHGNDLTGFNEGFIVSAVPNSDKTFLETMVLPHMVSLADELNTWEGYEIATEKYKRTLEKIVEQIKNVYGGKNNKTYSVLNHCDFHYKNIMFKKSEGIFKDILLLDFQCCIWGTPAIDVLYLLFMMGDFQARQERDKIIKFYYDEFEATMKKIGYIGKIPSLLDLNLELLKNGALEILFVFSMILWQFVDFSNMKAEDLFDTNLDQTALQNMLFKHPEYQKVVKAEIPRLINLGILG